VRLFLFIAGVAEYIVLVLDLLTFRLDHSVYLCLFVSFYGSIICGSGHRSNSTTRAAVCCQHMQTLLDSGGISTRSLVHKLFFILLFFSW
jgi:hypothetical protein